MAWVVTLARHPRTTPSHNSASRRVARAADNTAAVNKAKCLDIINHYLSSGRDGWNAQATELVQRKTQENGRLNLMEKNDMDAIIILLHFFMYIWWFLHFLWCFFLCGKVTSFYQQHKSYQNDRLWPKLSPLARIPS